MRRLRSGEDAQVEEWGGCAEIFSGFFNKRFNCVESCCVCISVICKPLSIFLGASTYYQ